MSSRWRLFSLAIPFVLVASCSNEQTHTGPLVSSCPEELQAVTPRVSVGAAVSFDWTPRCTMALAIVEEGTRDAWWVAVPGWVEDAPTTNAISPPINYGDVRSGLEHSDSTALLVAGRTYTFSLWRVLPQGSTVPCQGRIGRACLVATTTFRR